MTAVIALKLEHGIGVASSCHALGLPRGSFYRRQRAAEIPRPRRRSPRALTAPERQEVLDVLHRPEYVDKAAHEVYALLLDAGRYICSPRTMYRILETEQELKERRDQARHPAYVKPELLATGPNQVWSWDITRIKGPAKWTYFYLYVILDIFSRFVVGWMLAQRENARLARRLIAETVEREGIDKNQLTLHSDRGAPMKAGTTAQLLAHLGVEPSFSRPRTSNDNPFSEAQFKTLKYHPLIPDRVASYDHGLGACRDFFHWCNFKHRHSGIGYLTPAMLHYGQAKTVVAERQTVLAKAYATHPERFVRGLPKPQQPPTEVWINPPATVSPDVVPGDASGTVHAH